MRKIWAEGELSDIEAEAKNRRYECLWQYLFYAERVECLKDSAEGREHG